MNAARQSWLVATRELRERGRSRAFLLSLVLTVILVAAMIALPSMLGGGKTRNVGVTGSSPALAAAIEAQGKGVGITTHIRSFGDLGAGEKGVRQGDVDVLVVDGRRLEWRSRVDQQLQAVVTGAIQLVAVRERAAAAGISSGTLGAVLAPVAVSNVQLGAVAGRTQDDEAAATIMTIVLLIGISTYGGLVLSGVVEEKSSRVVEVLLARMPARNLLAGKIAGIGLLGLAQITLTAVVALVAAATVPDVDLPSVRAGVLVWLVVWFVLGYMVYATAYGALGSLASRPEDAQSVTGPVTALLVVAYFASFTSVGQPDGVAAHVVSYLPVTAPMAMPSRIAMGGAAWWEPVVAAVLALVTVGALLWFGGRVYAGAVLHSGPTLKLRDAWRSATGRGTSTREFDGPVAGGGAVTRLWERHRHRPTH